VYYWRRHCHSHCRRNSSPSVAGFVSYLVLRAALPPFRARSDVAAVSDTDDSVCVSQTCIRKSDALFACMYVCVFNDLNKLFIEVYTI
jgi:hypothetical protein